MGHVTDSGESEQLPFRWGSISASGKVREANEDAFLADAEMGLFAVSDGMGGRQAGSLASKIVVTLLPGMVYGRLKGADSPDPKALLRDLRQTVLDLSHCVRQKGLEHDGMKGMGATVVVALLRGNAAHIAHVGDSRAYLFRSGQCNPLTEDHSMAQAMVRTGMISPEGARDHPARSRLLRYLGMDGEVTPDVCAVPLHQGDRLLLCSDGLTGMVDDHTIATLATAYEQPKEACQALYHAANAAGGYDNITVVIVDWVGAERAQATAPAKGSSTHAGGVRP